MDRHVTSTWNIGLPKAELRLVVETAPASAKNNLAPPKKEEAEGKQLWGPCVFEGKIHPSGKTKHFDSFCSHFSQISWALWPWCAQHHSYVPEISLAHLRKAPWSFFQSIHPLSNPSSHRLLPAQQESVLQILADKLLSLIPVASGFVEVFSMSPMSPWLHWCPSVPDPHDAGNLAKVPCWQSKMKSVSTFAVWILISIPISLQFGA